MSTGRELAKKTNQFVHYAENYTLINAKASYNITQNLKLFVSGENLFGANYQVNRYYTMPEATLFSGLSYKF